MAKEYLARSVVRHWRPAEAKLRKVWAIGVYGGESPLDLQPLEGVENPVLTRADISDCVAQFVADPFALRVGDQWFLFFEILDQWRNQGRIGLATSPDAGRWRYEGVVLSEPFHLSYPHVFSYNGRFFMLPESGTTNTVRLYEANLFPRRWRYAATLLEGRAYLDASLVQWSGRWWLFATEENAGKYDTLHLFSSLDLFGPWQEHPASPVVRGDIRAARPAGKPLVWEGRLFRFAQDCFSHYGAAVRAFEIRRLTVNEYKEAETLPHLVLAASGRGWNASGMHHLDLHRTDRGWLAFVDGHVDLLE